MFRQHSGNRRPGQWEVLLSLLCVALVLLAGTISATHTHTQGDISHADCSLCASAHAVVQVAAAPAPVAVAQVYTTVESFVPPARTRNLARFALFTRPPPANA